MNIFGPMIGRVFFYQSCLYRVISEPDEHNHCRIEQLYIGTDMTRPRGTLSCPEIYKGEIPTLNHPPAPMKVWVVMRSLSYGECTAVFAILRSEEKAKEAAELGKSCAAADPDSFQWSYWIEEKTIDG